MNEQGMFQGITLIFVMCVIFFKIKSMICQYEDEVIMRHSEMCQSQSQNHRFGQDLDRVISGHC